MQYNSELVQVKLLMSGNSVVFEDIKISFGLFISAWKNQAELQKSNFSIDEPPLMQSRKKVALNLINLCY